MAGYQVVKRAKLQFERKHEGRQLGQESVQEEATRKNNRNRKKDQGLRTRVRRMMKKGKSRERLAAAA